MPLSPAPQSGGTVPGLEGTKLDAYNDLLVIYKDVFNNNQTPDNNGAPGSCLPSYRKRFRTIFKNTRSRSI